MTHYLIKHKGISNGRRKRTLSDHLRPSGSKMCLVPPSTGRRIVTGPFAATQTWPKYASGLRLSERCADAAVVRPVLARACLAGVQMFRLPWHYLRAARCSFYRTALMARLGFRERALLGGVAVAGH
jgi:hypothetical protein